MNAAPAMARVKKTAKKDVADLIRKHAQTLDRAKQLYDRADKLLAQILEPYLEECDQCGHKYLPAEGEAVMIPLNADGKMARLLDNWEGETIAWGHGAARRFGVKISKS